MKRITVNLAADLKGVSAVVGILAAARYWIWGADLPGLSRALGILSIALVIRLSWAALALIMFTGWDFLPQRTR